MRMTVVVGMTTNVHVVMSVIVVVTAIVKIVIVIVTALVAADVVKHVIADVKKVWNVHAIMIVTVETSVLVTRSRRKVIVK